MCCLFTLLYIIQNTIHQNSIKCIIENSVFCIVMGCQNANEEEFHGFGSLVIWLWKTAGYFFKGVCTNPV